MRFATLVVLYAIACGCDPGAGAPDMGEADMAPQRVQIAGAVQKGPFVLGSSVQLSVVDDKGNPLGQVFPTKTTDDLGSFSLELTYQGYASLEATGYYYNEATGKLSDSTLTLRAFYDITTTGTQSAYVNIFTHLTYDRVKALLGATPPMTLADATKKAEEELRTALGVGGATFDPMARGIDMTLTGGDNDANAYLFAVSAILSLLAVDQAAGGSVDAALQQLINTTSSKFAATGHVPGSLPNDLLNVQTNVEPKPIMDNFAARLLAIESTAVVPDLNRVWDTDGDAYANNVDNCPLTRNVAQLPVNGLCTVRTLANGKTPYSRLLTGDFNSDGNIDVMSVLDKFAVFPGDGTGKLDIAASIDSTLADSLMEPDLEATDMDGDGKLDVLGNLVGATRDTFVFYGDGAGHFGSPTRVIGTPIPPASSKLQHLVSADFDNDGRKDVLGASVQSNEVWFVLANAARGWAPASKVTFPVGININITAMMVADFTGDGKPDVLVSAFSSINTPTWTGGLFMLVNNGTTGATFNGFTVTGPDTSVGTSVGAFGHGDVNGDGKVDVVVLDYFNAVPMLGNGTGGFTLGNKITYPWHSSGYILPVGKLTSDGNDDFVMGNQGIVVGSSNGNGFTLARVPNTSFFSGSPTAADLNHDGKLDIIIQDLKMNLFTILINP